MSLGTHVRVVLDKKLNDAECKKVYQHVSAIKGVLQASFNEKAKEVLIMHAGDDATIEPKIQKIKGVKALTYLPVG